MELYPVSEWIYKGLNRTFPGNRYELFIHVNIVSKTIEGISITRIRDYYNDIIEGIKSLHK